MRLDGEVAGIEEPHLRVHADELDRCMRQLPGFRRDQRGIAHALQVLPPGHVQRVEAAQRFAVGGSTTATTAARPSPSSSFRLNIGTRFESQADLEKTLHNYLKLYNPHMPQRAIGSKTPIQALKKWQKQSPDLFVKRVYEQTGLDTYA